MFKAHILVSEDTDVAAELADLERIAKKHQLDDVRTMLLLQNVETVLARPKTAGFRDGRLWHKDGRHENRSHS